MGLDDNIIFFNRLGYDNFESFFQRQQVFFVVYDGMGEEGCQLASDIVGFLGQVEMNESVQDLIADLLLF
jgi:hypothetical protein